MPLPDAFLESRLDLSASQILEPGPGQLWIASTRASGQMALVGISAAVCLLCAFLVWRQWSEGWLAALYPFGVLSAVFGIVSGVVLFGGQAKQFEPSQRRAVVRAWLGPIRDARVLPLPDKGTIRLAFRKEEASIAGSVKAMPTRWYDIDVVGLPSLGFTVAGDREAARAFAARLAKVLGYEVQDEVEADGVTRLKS